MIDDRTVIYVARLSRLELSEAERETFRAQLGGILQHFQSLQALALDDVPPTSHVLPVTNVLRDDVPGPSLPREEILAAAPAVEEGAFVVPPVIEGE